MDSARRRQAADSFFAIKEYRAEQQRALGIIAARLSLRPQKALKLSPEKMAGYLISLVTPDEALASGLIRGYLFGPQQGMLAMFLDELKIPHDKGAISVESVPAPETEVLRAAVEKLSAAFDSTDIAIYLNALWVSDPDTWANLPSALTPKA